MTAQPDTDRRETTTETAEARRFVVGRYLARVEALGPDGAARAVVTQPLAPPSDADLRAVYGPAWDERPESRAATEALQAFEVVGALPGELVDSATA